MTETPLMIWKVFSLIPRYTEIANELQPICDQIRGECFAIWIL